MADSTGGEHRVQITPRGGGQGKVTAPEKGLNGFVHFVALLERVGNALGTLAFTWATVVLLGGYPTVLRPKDDFWFTTTIVFLEASRMFTRGNRLDYQLFFSTRGAFRPLGWNGLLIVIVYFSDALMFIWKYFRNGNILVALLMTMAILLATGQLLSLGALRPLICNPLRRAISLWSPLIAILLMRPFVPHGYYDFLIGTITPQILMAKRIAYLVLFVSVLLVTISRLRFPSIIKLVDSALGSKLVFWRRVILNLCMFAAIVMVVYISPYPVPITMITNQVCALVVVSFGNLQIPAAVVRVVLALLRLIPHDYYGDDEKIDETKNLAPSLGIFYGMVLGQGILYVAASMLEVFSFIPRRFLVCRAGFRGRLGVEYVNLYYAYAFEKCMGGAVLAPKKISLITFAMDSLNSDSPKIQLYGVQMLHSLLKTEPFKAKTISKLTASTKTVTSMFNMLGWTSEGDTTVRLFAAKATAELANSLRVVPIPGAMQIIASLLDTIHRSKIKDPLLDTDSQEPQQDCSIQQVRMGEQNSRVLQCFKQIVIFCLIPHEEPSNMDEENSRLLRCWKWMTKCWSIPEEEPLTDQDLLAILGMQILDKLASFDIENCMEISRATDLISKIIDFTGNGTDMRNINDAQQAMLMGSSLKVLRRLAGTKGRFGVALRQKISEHPFLLSNLAEILDESRSSQELRELTVEILRSLAIDANTRQEIGHIRLITSRLMHAFLNRDAPSSTNSDHLLRKIAGQTLAVLAMDSVNNCLVMLREPGYVFIQELTIMIRDYRCRYAAASLLRNMCTHARSELSNSDLKELSYILREVLEQIMDTEGAELEILVGLCSQICNVIPEDFARELEDGQIMERFVNRLVNALNVNIKPAAHCPGIRRVIVEQAIYMMECNSSYANCFNKCGMMEALSMVERTPSRAEKYRFFLGDAGLMEHNIPLSVLAARAKELMGREWLRGVSSVT